MVKQLKEWSKVGELQTLGKKFGKWLVLQGFRNPTTGEIEEFALYGQKDWSVVLALTEHNEVIAVGQYKQGCDCIITELPAGTADFKGENPAEVMERELLEETGYKARRVIPLGSVWLATRNSPTQAHCFLALNCMKVRAAKIDSSEEIETKLMPLGIWLDQCINGLITEWSAVVTTMRALSHLNIHLVGQ